MDIQQAREFLKQKDCPLDIQVRTESCETREPFSENQGNAYRASLYNQDWTMDLVCSWVWKWLGTKEEFEAWTKTGKGAMAMIEALRDGPVFVIYMGSETSE